jgi:hypothetical protein
MRSRLCYAWFGDEGGGSGNSRRPSPEKKSHVSGLFHDGTKWVIKRNGVVVAQSKSTFAEGKREEQTPGK